MGMNVELRESAYHEAGHAVAAYILGVPIREAWINQDGTGGVRLEQQNVRQGTARWRAYCLYRAIVSLSGPIAQMWRSLDARSDPRWWRDRESIRKWLDQVDGDQGCRRLTPALAEATYHMLTEPHAWRAVALIAGSLEQGGRLAGVKVGAICNACGVRRLKSPARRSAPGRLP